MVLGAWVIAARTPAIGAGWDPTVRRLARRERRCWQNGRDCHQ